METASATTTQQHKTISFSSLELCGEYYIALIVVR